MTTWAVTRHPATREWLESNSAYQFDHIVDHLEVDQVQDGDTIIGTLPINMVADLVARSVRYIHIELQLTLDQRMEKSELTTEQLEQAGISLQEYRAYRV